MFERIWIVLWVSVCLLLKVVIKIGRLLVKFVELVYGMSNKF